ncbi:MAG: hypothetical protein M1820_005925 [Bogoriella megaspora]|nr:MAG: hypothetical protein M1820_005925 [Bogoriella megaspora]
MTSILNGLNIQQRDAVTSPADVLQVLAPPGSGKTKTLTTRVAYHISHDGIEPGNIIVCTFTIKAAREMKERIGGFIAQNLARNLVLGTFHSVARRYLVAYGHYIGIPKNFGIADSAETLSILKRIIKHANYRIEPAQARARISGLKARCISCDEHSASTASLKGEKQQEFAKVYTDYEANLQASNLLDYDDLLLRCKDLLSGYPQCVSNIEAVLIDEFQDTNVVQFDLMRLFAQRMRKITIVGDPDQSIYSFRSAEVKNLGKMQRRYPDYQLINLEENYRSSGAILNTAQEVIEQDESRPKKAFRRTRAQGECPILRKLPSAGDEAAWLVAEVKRCVALTAGLLKYSDFAILLRSAFLSQPIESELGKHGIPYRMVGGVRFFDRVEIKVLLDYLRVIHQPDQNDAVARVLNVPPRAIGENTVKCLLDEATSSDLSLWTIVRKAARGERTPATKLSKSNLQGLEKFVDVILSLQKRHKTMIEGSDETEVFSLKNLVDALLRKLDYKGHIKKGRSDEDFESRWANVNQLLVQAADISAAIFEGDADVVEEPLPTIEGVEQIHTSPKEDALSLLLANVALATEREKKDEEAEIERVTISTIHAAKGLEWPVVFIPAVYDGSIPHSRSDDTDEERRLLYVGMTRAKTLLFLSCPMKSLQSEENKLSKFIYNQDAVLKCMSRQGPTIDARSVQIMADILGKPSPATHDIERARAQTTVLEDIYWPVDGSHPMYDASLPETHLDSTHYDRYGNKRREVEGAALGGFSKASSIVSVSTTMQSQDQFTIASTTLSSGFVSAGEHFKQNKEPLQHPPSLKRLRSFQSSNSDPKLLKPTQKSRKKQISGQGSIANFFDSGGSKFHNIGDLLSGTTTETRPSTTRSALSEVSNSSSAQTLSSVPSLLTNRKPYSAPSRDRPRQTYRDENEYSSSRHVLVSSSPTKPDDDNVGEDRGSPPASPTKPPRINLVDFKPAATTHVTSIMQAQSAPAPGRRTLGTRRSVHGGWPPPKRN